MFLPPDFYGNIRAGLRAERTTGAFVIGGGFSGIKTLGVGFFTEKDQLFGAG